MTKSEEQSLYDLMKSGDLQARDELIMGHEPLVHGIVSKYKSSGPEDDLIQEGFLGLITAVDKYDINKGRLHVYAPIYIRKFIENFLNRMRYSVSVPRDQAYAILKLERIRLKLEQKYQRSLTPEDLVQDPEIIEAHTKFQQSQNSPISIDKYVSLLTYSETTYSIDPDIPLLDPHSENSIRNLEIKDFWAYLCTFLTKEERYILEAMANGRKRQDISEDLNIDIRKVSTIKYSAKKKLQQAAKENNEIQLVLESYGITI